MAGLLAWAADVVGGAQSNDEDDNPNSIPLIFTPEQQSYLLDLDRKSTSLTHMVYWELSLPSLREQVLQAQLREITLQEENAEYEKAISDYENKIREKSQEADLLRSKLQRLEELLRQPVAKITVNVNFFVKPGANEMALIEENLQLELERAQPAAASESVKSNDCLVKNNGEDQEDEELANSALLGKLEEKKKELTSMEEAVHDLEKKWAEVQDYALQQPSPAQREKILDKQLHSLIEQLASKQAQAEGLANEVHLKEMELERLNGLWRKLEASSGDINATRNRYARSSIDRGRVSSDYIIDPRQKPSRLENLHKLMLLRSAFVVYILALHILVFIKISF
ncbi:hypothetical protein HAX54_044192 [Datura stramonium]|uniref:Uncharacterized protein n=1 Tax=Datura stramonium TaxID=4076 RepID=A0ABS8W4U4_DATST|nr:hypothetical protein [Datura stramonium]